MSHAFERGIGVVSSVGLDLGKEYNDKRNAWQEPMRSFTDDL